MNLHASSGPQGGGREISGRGRAGLQKLFQKDRSETTAISHFHNWNNQYWQENIVGLRSNEDLYLRHKYADKEKRIPSFQN